MVKKILLVIGSTRQNRLSPTIADWIIAQVAQKSDLELSVVDLKELNLPFFDERVSPSIAPVTTQSGMEWAAKAASADAFIILTSEYNAGYPAPLKNAIDYLYSEWKNRPITIVSYGFSGGASAAAQLKQVFERLESILTDSGVAIDIGQIIDESGMIIDADTKLASYETSLAKALTEISEYTIPTNSKKS